MAKKNRFFDELRTTVLIGDGAIGTELFARGAVLDTGVERLNLTAPDLVAQLHRDYVAAGSRIIETNTFAANRLSLRKYNAEKELADIIAAGVRLARQAAGSRVYVAGSVGPLPPVDGEPLSESELEELFGEPVGLLLDNRVDLLIFETFIDLDQLTAAIRVARRITDIPIIAQMAFEVGGTTSGGDAASEFVKRCIDAGADVVGANCGGGVTSILDAVDRIAAYGVPMSAYMNAGFAERIEQRRLFLAPSEYLANNACELVRRGVRIIGGCCGTSPETIRAIADTLARRKLTGDARTVVVPREPVVEKERVDTGKPEIQEPPKGILVELDPPRNPDIAKLVSCAEQLRDAGVQGITLADNPLASVRVDVLTVAGLLSGTGLPVIPHLTGRDRNRIALQSTIMGAHVLGVRSFLCVTGDPIRMYHETNTSGVFDVTSIGLVKLVAEFNSGKRLNGRGRTSFSIGVALNPNVRNIDGQISKLQRKIDAGAHFALTQPIFHVDRLEMLQNALAKAGITLPVYIGMMPLVSSRQADFLHYEVPGIYIPEHIRRQLARFEDMSDQQKKGSEIAQELVERIVSRVHGLYMIPTFNRVDSLLPVIAEARRNLS